MIMSHEVQLKKSLYRNWVKAALALKYLKEGITTFVDTEVKSQQTSFLNDIGTTLRLTSVTCGQCTTENILTCPTKGICYKQGKTCSYHTPGKLPRLCPNQICDKLAEKIITQHRYGSPSWKNTDATRWCTNHWELAKCFISESGYTDKTTAAETDCTGVLSVAINGLFMQNVLATPINQQGDIFSKNRQARNTILHSSDLEVTDVQLVQYIDDMIALLNDNKQLMNQPDAIVARQKLNQLKSEKLVITTSDEQDVLKEALKSIEERQNAALQAVETKLLDSLADFDTKQQELVIYTNENKIQIRDSLMELINDQKRNLDETKDKIVGDLTASASTTEASVVGKLDTKLLETLNILKNAQNDCQKKQSDLLELINRIQEVDANLQQRHFDIQQLFRNVQQGLHNCQTEIRSLQTDILVVKDRHNCKLKEIYQKQQLQQRLRQMYKRHLSTVPITPLLRYIKSDLNKVYTTLVIRNDYINDPVKSEHSTNKEVTVRSYKDIFYRDNSSCKNIFVLGDAGIGKTTWSLKLVNTWLDCLEKKEQNSAMNDDEQILLAYEYVFYISLRNAKSDGQISDMIQNQLFFKDPYLNSISKEIIENEPEKCLILLDGLDEWSKPENIPTIDDTDLPGRNNIQDCTILTTTRPWKLASMRLPQHEIDRAVEIKGLDYQGIIELSIHIIENLDSRFGSVESVDTFLTYINKHNFERFISVPIMLSALVCLWYKTKGDLDSTMAGLYSGLVDILIKYAEGDTQVSSKNLQKCKLSDISNLDKLKEKWSRVECDIPKCLSSRINCKMYGPLILKLGKLAFNGLFSNDRELSLVFTHESIKDYIMQDELDIALQIGILSQTKVVGNVLEEEFSISFLHKTMQEFLASVYMVSGDEQQRAVNCNTYKAYCNLYEYVFEMENILLFVSGMCAVTAEKISEYLSETLAVMTNIRIDDFESVVNTFGDFRKLRRLLTNCIKQETALTSDAHHIYIKYHLLLGNNILTYCDGDTETMDSETMTYLQQHSEHRCMSLAAVNVNLDKLCLCLKQTYQLEHLCIWADIDITPALHNIQRIEHLTLHDANGNIDLTEIVNLKTLTLESITTSIIILPPQGLLQEVKIRFLTRPEGSEGQLVLDLGQQMHLVTLQLEDIESQMVLDLSKQEHLETLKLENISIGNGHINLSDSTNLKTLWIESITTDSIIFPTQGCLYEVDIRSIKSPTGAYSQLVLDLRQHVDLKTLLLENIGCGIYDLSDNINLKTLTMRSITTDSIKLPEQECLQEVVISNIRHPLGEHVELDLSQQKQLKTLTIENTTGVIQTYLPNSINFEKLESATGDSIIFLQQGCPQEVVITDSAIPQSPKGQLMLDFIRKQIHRLFIDNITVVKQIDLSHCAYLTTLTIKSITTDSVILPQQGHLQEIVIANIRHPLGADGHVKLDLNQQCQLETLNTENITGVIQMDLSHCYNLNTLTIKSITTDSVILPQQGHLREILIADIRHPLGTDGHVKLYLNQQRQVKALNIENITGVIHIDSSTILIF